ncbi:TetR family transcriptional regulator [Microbacterium jejuense]|uniref:TetR family transcriptional regulator n=1 Tax=Microbacterium jejuense TaxID=1263637 RepID=A0ABS7HN60_9MICO|nr:TetR/AcrR family transcriptional regulator [Microbacterium jejuense]MBW9094108.1 TetR family transcriptional regulator [Microbacterium jejuense]
MPKRVDHDERRREIAAAVFRVTARDGLDAASLRHVATEAGVTAGMVQHYFPSKDAMLRYAMGEARARYEERMTAAIEALGPDPTPRAVLGTMLQNLIPRTAAEIDDGRVSLAFQAHAATHAELSAQLADDDALLLGHVAQLVTAAAGSSTDASEATVVATGLLATAEGLGLKVLSAGLDPAAAVLALERQLGLALPTRSHS